MAEIMRAVYKHGQLRPLDPLALTDGQEIRLAHPLAAGARAVGARGYAGAGRH